MSNQKSPSNKRTIASDTKIFLITMKIYAVMFIVMSIFTYHDWRLVGLMVLAAPAAIFSMLTDIRDIVDAHLYPTDDKDI